MANEETSGKNPKQHKEYKPEFEMFEKEPATFKGNNGETVNGHRLIPNRVICFPTPENPYHEQGKEYVVGADAATDHIRKGMARFVRTKAEDDKIKFEKGIKA